MDIKKIKNTYRKSYAHFDKRVSIIDVWSKITNPDYISSHGFYPLIKYTKVSKKYSENAEHKNKKKERDICYSAHIDRCIFQYYSYLLNEEYNKRAVADNIDGSAVAYRNNQGLNNIHLAKKAFDTIRSYDSCYVMIGDFTDFFGSLDHKYLKQMLCSLLQVKKLPNDYYAVFKNITKYTTWDLKKLLEINELNDTKNGRKELNSKETVITREQFKKYKAKQIIQNKNSFGIPQGTAISAVLANIYMLEADKTIQEHVVALNGLYMRYSDDFLVIIPKDREEFNSFYIWLSSFLNSLPNVKLSADKTKLFHYTNNTVKSCNSTFQSQMQNGVNIINFLGFSFDGKEVNIRSSTISKYYNKMYRKAKTIRENKMLTADGKIITCRKIYEKYSIKGAKPKKLNGRIDKKSGNFLTYVHRANNIFENKEPIKKHTKRHMFKIHRAIHR